MKKSLLIILSLILTQIATFAVGVDCWEEHSPSYRSEAETVSKMKDVLGKNVEIIKVKTEIEGVALNFSDGLLIGNTRVALKYPITAYYSNKNSDTQYILDFDGGNYGLESNGYGTKVANLYSSYRETSGYVTRTTATGEYGTAYTADGQYLEHYYNNYNSQSVNVFYINKHFVHTFCIANTNSGGGGGGGAAGAAVNYIIKAD